MEVTSWNLHHGSFPQGTYTMEVKSLNLLQGNYLVELTPWMLPH